MIVDGVFSSEALDTAGERMDIRGCDITSLNSGKAALNFEHRSGIKGTPLDLVGRILSAKKIFAEADCANDRERHYWQCVKMPLIYGVARLFDEDGSPGAVSLAASIRDSIRHKAPLMLGFSIEGSTVHKDGHHLRTTVARGVAATIKPANRTCEAGVLDPGVPTEAQLDKAEADVLSRGPVLELFDPAGLEGLAKTLDAGSTDVVGGQAVQGAALQKVDPTCDVHWQNPDRDHAWEVYAQSLPGPRAERVAQAVGRHGASWYGQPVHARVVPSGDLGKAELPGPAGALTQRGQVLVPHPLLAAPRLDEERGILHTPRGSVELDPGVGLGDFLHHEGLARLHRQAAAGWERAHKLLAEGRLPSQAVAHAAAAAGLSPAAHRALMDYAVAHRTDARSAAGALTKHAQDGHPEPLPEATPGAARRALTLMGGGSVLPHDPNVMRQVLGLDRRDGATGMYASQLLDDPDHPHLAAGLDRWYAGRHAAARHVIDDPELSKAVPGVDHVVGLGALAHGLAAPALDRARGEGRRGRPDVLDPHRHPLAKGEAIADVRDAYERQGGPGRADLLYLAFLLPRILDAAQHDQAGADAHRILAGATPSLERAVVHLRGMVPDLTGGPTDEECWPGGPQIRAVGIHGLTNDGSPVRAGRVMIIGGQMQHLEDYHGLLSRLLPEGPLNADAVARLHALQASPHLNVSIDHAVQAPSGDDAPAQVVPEQDPAQAVVPAAQPAATPPATEAYRYRRAGAERDALLEVSGDHAYLDGEAIPGSLVDLMLANVDSGAATLVPAGGLDKAEWEDLAKADVMDPGDALQHIRAAVKAGHVHPDVEAALTRHIFVDPMTAQHSIGNKYAATKFLEQKKPGVYVTGDSNDFREINNKFGHETGDAAIQGIGGAMRQAHTEAFGHGSDGGKLFRIGGDEFLAHFPSHEHALKFLHHARKTFDNLPPVGGTHKISMSFGLGHDLASSDAALYDAKKGKLTSSGERAYAPGQVPMLAHSRVPGKEGAIPLHHEAHPNLPPAPSPPATVRAVPPGIEQLSQAS